MGNVRVTMPMIRRMQQLRDAKLSCEAIATVIGLDFGDRPSARTVSKHTESPFAGRDFLAAGRPRGMAGMSYQNGGRVGESDV